MKALLYVSILNYQCLNDEEMVTNMEKHCMTFSLMVNRSKGRGNMLLLLIDCHNSSLIEKKGANLSVLTNATFANNNLPALTQFSYESLHIKCLLLQP